jgi:hypothetical protein
VTIDTEEDNWGEYDRPSFSVENLGRIPRLQEMFNARGIRPTYLITHPVATSAMGVETLGGYREEGLCEIGTHLHPWNTPPLEELRTPFNSYVSHLPAALQLRKIRTLDDVARCLIRLGYRVDTSISPAIDWREYEGPDYSDCTAEPFVYRIDRSAQQGGGSLLEVPATVDFVQAPRGLASWAYRSIRSKIPFGGKILGALGRLGALNLVCVSPEIDSVPRMIRLTRALLDRGAAIINMFFHSPSLLEGCSPYGRTPADVEGLLARIDAFMAFAQSVGLRPVTMSELTPADVRASRVKVLPPHPAV